MCLKLLVVATARADGAAEKCSPGSTVDCSRVLFGLALDPKRGLEETGKCFGRAIRGSHEREVNVRKHPKAFITSLAHFHDTRCLLIRGFLGPLDGAGVRRLHSTNFLGQGLEALRKASPPLAGKGLLCACWERIARRVLGGMRVTGTCGGMWIGRCHHGARSKHQGQGHKAMPPVSPIFPRRPPPPPQKKKQSLQDHLN